MAKEIGEPYWFTVGPHVWGYGNTPEEAIKNAKASGGLPRSTRGKKVKFRVFGPCMDAHKIGCSLVTGAVEWRTETEDGEDLPEMAWEDREVKVAR